MYLYIFFSFVNLFLNSTSWTHLNIFLSGTLPTELGNLQQVTSL